MKSYIISSIEETMNLGKKLDSIAMLQNKEWTVYTDDPSPREKFIFMKDGRLINSINGLTTNYKWEYISINSSIIIEDSNSTLLFKIVFCDKNILILNLDGTREFCFLINTSNAETKLLSYEDIQWYLKRNSKIDILTDLQRREYEEKKKREEEKLKLIVQNEVEVDERLNNIFLWLSLALIFILIIVYLLCK